MEFLHIGLPTRKKQENEIYVEGMKVWMTDCETTEYNIEFLRFEPESWMPGLVQSMPHVAFLVDDIEKEIPKFEEVLVKPFEFAGKMFTFVLKENLIFELSSVIKK